MLLLASGVLRSMFSLTRMWEITAEAPPDAVAYDSQDWLKLFRTLVALLAQAVRR